MQNHHSQPEQFLEHGWLRDRLNIKGYPLKNSKSADLKRNQCNGCDLQSAPIISGQSHA